MFLFEALVLGGLVGLALGLTGAGGATLAVPLLVFGLALSATDAVAVSLLAVAASAVYGFVLRLRRHEVDVGAGAVLAASGAVAAPFGVAIGHALPESLLLGGFGALVAVVSYRMWMLAGRPTDPLLGPCAVNRRISWRCFSTLSGAGAITGLLSGLFGVGGGFVVVPAIIFATGTTMHKAVATSLMVISVVSVTAFVSMIAGGRQVSWAVGLPFLAGSVAGMIIGSALGRRFSGPRLQRTFAIGLAVLGVVIVSRAIAGP